jgi:hypothetical protein
MSNGGQTAFDAEIAAVREEVGERWSEWLERLTSPEEMRAIELEIAALARQVADALTESLLRTKLSVPEFVAPALAAALSSSKPMRRSGSAKVPVTLLGGRRIELKVPYLRPDYRGRPGPKRKPGQHGKAGVGMHPTLEVLGIRWNTTPAVQGEVMRQVAASESFRPGLEALQARGIDLGYKQTLRLVHEFGAEAVKNRAQWVQAVRLGEVAPSRTLAGKKVVLAIDGGRLRLRVPKTRGRRRKSGHRGFDTPWCEPKLGVIYVVGPSGELESSFRPVYDGTLEDCDAVFALLVAYLWALGAGEAESLTVLGDGAKWIWERAEGLTSRLGLRPGALVQIVDKYHATEYLSDVAKTTPCLGERDRAVWLKRTARLLDRGDALGVADEIEHLAATAQAPELAARADYFRRNVERMRYLRFKRRGLPIGSGAAESAIRRVINLRLKGNAKFWLAENAEAMLMMRCYLKTGRFDDFLDWATHAAVRWRQTSHEVSPLGPDGGAQLMQDKSAA